MKIAAVTPILGEFGYIVFDIQPRVRWWLRSQNAERKIVFASRELSCLFEEATEIIEPPADLLPTAPATMRSIYFEHWVEGDPQREKIQHLVKWAKSVVDADYWLEIPYFATGPWPASATFTPLQSNRPAPQNPYIVVAARARAFDAWRNWPADSWDELVGRIRNDWNIEVRAIGRPPSTYYPSSTIPQEIGEIDRLSDSISLLNHAVCSISSNSGPTHLSLMAGCPTFCWGELFLKPFMEHQTNPLKTLCCFLPVDWQPSVDVVWKALSDWRASLESLGQWNGGVRRLPRPRLSMCMIARDSSRTIGAALESITPWVDEMVVVDTGSVDNTAAIAEAAGARVFHAAWQDSFSQARNESLDHARGEWILWMDTDDTIDQENGQALKELVSHGHAPSVMAFVMQVHCPAAPDSSMLASKTVVDHVKIFRNVPAIRFEGRIHEQVLASIRKLGGSVEWTAISVVHSGSDQSPQGRVRKRSRDLRLLQMELKESPDSTFALFNLGMTLLDAAQPTEALNALCRSLQLADKGESHVRKIHALLVQCYWELNRLETAYWSCMQGLEAFPNDPELLFRKGSIEQSFGRLADAERSFLAAMSLRSDRHFSSLDIGIVGSKAWHNLAVIYTQQSRHAEAANAWKNAIQRGSHNRVAWRGYLEALSALGDKAGLSDAQSMCVASNVSSDILALVRARVLAENGNFQIAASVLEDALSRFDSLDLLEELCQTAFRGDLLDVAERRLSELTKRQPREASAFRNLGIIHLRRNQRAQAADCATRALQLRPDYKAAQELLRLATES